MTMKMSDISTAFVLTRRCLRKAKVSKRNSTLFLFLFLFIDVSFFLLMKSSLCIEKTKITVTKKNQEEEKERDYLFQGVRLCLYKPMSIEGVRQKRTSNLEEEGKRV